MPSARLLTAGDEPATTVFLEAHADVTMFLRSNLAAGGLVDGGERFQGTWAAAFAGDAIVGIGALFWNGMLVLAAPVGLDAVAAALAVAAPRPLAGLIGPWDELVRARRYLGLEGRTPRLESQEDLFSLDLADLRPPPARGCTVRRAVAADVPLLTEWRHAYGVEALGDPPDGDPAITRREIEAQLAARRAWVVEEDGAPRAMSMFNAQAGDAVQVGGVYTPPAARGRGLAKACVAGSLLDARAEGARRAILFTGKDNEPARRAYLAIGFRIVGEYGMVFY